MARKDQFEWSVRTLEAQNPLSYFFLKRIGSGELVFYFPFCCLDTKASSGVCLSACLKKKTYKKDVNSTTCQYLVAKRQGRSYEIPGKILTSELGRYVEGSRQSVAVRRCGNVQHSLSHTVPMVFSHLRQMPTTLLSGMMVTARLVSMRTSRPAHFDVFALSTRTGSLQGPKGLFECTMYVS